jgi:hypothetical protein
MCQSYRELFFTDTFVLYRELFFFVLYREVSIFRVTESSIWSVSLLRESSFIEKKQQVLTVREGVN